MVVRAAVAALFVWLAGCDVGAVNIGGGGPDGGGNGSQTFQTQIAPLVTRCTACHSTTQPPNLSSYDSLQAKYKMKPGAQNILVTKGDATQGMHEGIQYFSDADKATVTSWIDSL